MKHLDILKSFLTSQTVEAETDCSKLAVTFANHIIQLVKPTYEIWSQQQDWDDNLLSTAINNAIKSHDPDNSSFKAEFECRLLEAMSDQIMIDQDFEYRDYIQENVPLLDEDSEKHFSSVIPSFDSSEFVDTMVDRIVGYLQETDKSSVLDAIGDREYIEMSFNLAPDNDVEYQSSCCSVETVELLDDDSESPNPAIVALFTMANISPAVFANYLSDCNYATDVINSYLDLSEAVDPAIGNGEPIITMADLIDIIDNATYGGTIVVFGFISAKHFIETYESGKEVLVDGHPQVGIVDFCNGSGYVVGSKSTRVTLNEQMVMTSSTHHYSPDEIFGFPLRSTIIHLK